MPVPYPLTLVPVVLKESTINMSVKPGGAALVLAFLLGTGFTVPMSGGGSGEERAGTGSYTP